MVVCKDGSFERNNSNSCEFANNLATNSSSAPTTANNSTTTPWSNNKESPPNEEDSNEDDTDNATRRRKDSNEDDTDNATPAKATDPLAPKLTNNERVLVVSVTERRRETWGQKAEFLLAVIGFAVDLEWWWCIFNTVLCYVGVRWVAIVLYGIGVGTISSLRLLKYLETHLSSIERCWLRNMSDRHLHGHCITCPSFTSKLPWTSCDNPWNTAACMPVTNASFTANQTTPAKEFFERKVLEQYKSNGLDYMGPVKPTLALCVFGVFILVYFSLWKGVRSAGKVVWVTALAPYVVLIILLIRGVSLPGADEGIKYYLTPEWHKLKNSK
ncbi:hypothetical protein DOY81_011176, partial [Sarcophaga bullata]